MKSVHPEPSPEALAGSEPSARLRLVAVRIRRAIRGGDGSEWAHDDARAIHRDALWALYQHPEARTPAEWIFIHRPTGLQAPALYAKTQKGAAPVLVALERVGRDVTASKPGDAGPPEALAQMGRDIRLALAGTDTSGLHHSWDHYAKPLGNAEPAAHVQSCPGMNPND